jgi:hypothetical protein
MGKRGGYPRKAKMKKPNDAAGGALFVRQYMIDLFERPDGAAADWPLIAETLLLEAFHALDKKPGDPRVLELLRLAGEGAYSRQTANWADTLNLYPAQGSRQEPEQPSVAAAPLREDAPKC